MEQNLLELINKLNSQNTILIDTSFLIYHFEDIKPYSDVTAEILNNIGVKNSKIFLSIVSFTEVLVGLLKRKKPNLEKTFKDFIQNNPFISIVDFTYNISELAAHIRSETGMGLADSIIIATAIKTKSSFLVTNDAKFLKVNGKGVKVIMLDDLVARL